MNVFFSDGVPFNNNMISLKGQYLKWVEDSLNMNANMERVLRSLQDDNNELENEIHDQTEQIETDKEKF